MSNAPALPLIPGQGLQGVLPAYDPSYEILQYEGSIRTNPDGNGGLIIPPVLGWSALKLVKYASGTGYVVGDQLQVVGLDGTDPTANGTGDPIIIQVATTTGYGSVSSFFVVDPGLYSIQPTDEAGDPVPITTHAIYNVSGGSGIPGHTPAQGAKFYVYWNDNGAQQGFPLAFTVTPSPNLLNRRLYAFIYANQTAGSGSVTGNFALSIDLYRPNVSIPQSYALVFPSTVTPDATVPSFFSGKGSPYAINVSMQYASGVTADPKENNISPFLIQTPIEKIIVRFDYATGWIGKTTLDCFVHYYFGIISSH